MTGDERETCRVSDADDRSDQPAEMSLDTVLELLTPRRRRFVLYGLLEAANGVVPFRSLVEDVATLEAATAGEGVTRDGYVGVAVDLHRWHLPVLSDVGVVEYDERSGAIRYHAHPTLETWARRLRHDELDRG